MLAGLFVITVTLRHFFSKHSRYRRYAKREYHKIQKIESDALKFGHLRHLNPFVFEELIIYALKRKGWKAWHGRKYTGDGGIDGYAKYKGVKYYIQDKRYQNHINPQHVINFAQICERDSRHGLFIHTGKTGEKSWKMSSNCNIEIVSGHRLLRLISDKDDSF